MMWFLPDWLKQVFLMFRDELNARYWVEAKRELAKLSGKPVVALTHVTVTQIEPEVLAPPEVPEVPEELEMPEVPELLEEVVITESTAIETQAVIEATELPVAEHESDERFERRAELDVESLFALDVDLPSETEKPTNMFAQELDREYPRTGHDRSRDR